MSCEHTPPSGYIRYTTADNMHESHRFNAAAYTLYVGDLPICAESVTMAGCVYRNLPSVFHRLL